MMNRIPLDEILNKCGLSIFTHLSDAFTQVMLIVKVMATKSQHFARINESVASLFSHQQKWTHEDDSKMSELQNTMASTGNLQMLLEKCFPNFIGETMGVSKLVHLLNDWMFVANSLFSHTKVYVLKAGIAICFVDVQIASSSTNDNKTEMCRRCEDMFMDKQSHQRR